MDIIDKIEELIRKTMCVEYVSDLTLEIQSRQLQKTKYFKGIQTTPGIGNQYIIFDYGNRERSQ